MIKFFVKSVILLLIFTLKVFYIGMNLSLVKFFKRSKESEFLVYCPDLFKLDFLNDEAFIKLYFIFKELDQKNTSVSVITELQLILITKK